MGRPWYARPAPAPPLHSTKENVASFPSSQPITSPTSRLYSALPPGRICSRNASRAVAVSSARIEGPSKTARYRAALGLTVCLGFMSAIGKCLWLCGDQAQLFAGRQQPSDTVMPKHTRVLDPNRDTPAMDHLARIFGTTSRSLPPTPTTTPRGG